MRFVSFGCLTSPAVTCKVYDDGIAVFNVRVELERLDFPDDPRPCCSIVQELFNTSLRNRQRTKKEGSDTISIDNCTCKGAVVMVLVDSD